MSRKVDWDCFSWHVRDALEQSKGSLRDMQKLTGVDHATLSRICHGKPCRVDAYLAICELLEVDPMYFFEREDERATV